jgi:hypothetical protein
VLNEGRVYFGLFGDDFDPESLAIGVVPTKTARKAIPMPKQSSWMYSSERVRGEVIDVYKMSASLVADLEPHIQNIREAMQRHGLEAVLEVVLTITPDDSVSTPILGFDQTVIAFLNDIGGTIDVDLYRGES